MQNEEGWMKNDEGWMKNDEGWMKNDDWWMMKDDDFKLLRGFTLRWTNKRTDIYDCRVAFVTEKATLYSGAVCLYIYCTTLQ